MVVLDASVWVARLLTDEVRHSQSRTWLLDWMSGGSTLVVPRIFVAEVGAAVARRTDSGRRGQRAIAQVRNEPLIEIRDLTRERWDRGADLAAQLQLRAADAAYVTLAEELGLPLLTWDQEILTRASDVIDVRTPNQMPI